MYLIENPFYLLKASPKDNRKKLLELADAAAFDMDSIKANESRSILSNPRKRLEAEISFFPGNTGMGKKIFSSFRSKKYDLTNMKNEWKLNSLSYANLIANLIDKNNSDFENIYLIRLLIKTFNEFDLSEIKFLINEDRSTSGFPEVENNKDIEDQINSRKSFYLGCIKKYTSELKLNIYSSLLVSLIEETNAIKEPILLSGLIDSFELQFKQYVLTEEEKVTSIIENIKTMTSSDYTKSALKKLVIRLNKELREWDKLVQPIQLSTQKRGLEHIQSKNLGFKVRNLALELNNTHNERDLAHSITLNLMDVFQEVTTISDLSKKDSEVLKSSREEDKVISEVMEYITDAKKNAKENPNQIFIISEKLISLCSPLLEDVKENHTDDFYCFISDRVALCLNGLAVYHGNKSKRFKESILILKKALTNAAEADTVELIEDNIKIYMQNLGLSVHDESSLNNVNDNFNEAKGKIGKIGDFFGMVFGIFSLIFVIIIFLSIFSVSPGAALFFLSIFVFSIIFSKK